MQIRRAYIPLLTGIDLTTRRIPYLIAKTETPGPTIWVTAAIHGDEVTGTAIIQSLFRRFESRPLIKGTVYAVPILNPTGFETMSRREIYAEADLNRHFGGDLNGTTPDRLAAKILTAILDTQPDYVIDIHSDSRNSVSYSLVDFPKTLKDTAVLHKSIAIAQTLDFMWAIDTEKTAGYPLEQCLTGRLLTEGIPAITMEIGWPMVVLDEYRKLGADAIWKFLASLEMVEGTVPLNNTLPTTVYTFTERVTTQSTGIIEFRVRPGDTLEEGSILGKVRNVFGEKIETIKSPLNGLLFSHEDESVTFPGKALFTLVEQSNLTEIEDRAAESLAEKHASPPQRTS